MIDDQYLVDQEHDGIRETEVIPRVKGDVLDLASELVAEVAHRTADKGSLSARCSIRMASGEARQQGPQRGERIPPQQRPPRLEVGTHCAQAIDLDIVASYPKHSVGIGAHEGMTRVRRISGGAVEPPAEGFALQPLEEEEGVTDRAELPLVQCTASARYAEPAIRPIDRHLDASAHGDPIAIDDLRDAPAHRQAETEAAKHRMPKEALP